MAAVAQQTEISKSVADRYWIAAGVAIICIASFAAYGLVLGGQLGIVLDDDGLVTNNRLVQAPDGLYRMWFTTEPTDYWPLTSTTFWLEWRLWGANPTGYHVVNLLLHVVECLLLWRILYRLSIPGAFLAALLFAVHPVNVESVAWIAQRKNVLAMLFYLLSVLWYLRAEERPTPWNRWYWLSLVGFLLAMLSKGSVAVLPLVLLLLVWWQRPLSWRDVAKTAPFFAIAAALTLVNIWFQTHGADLVLRKLTVVDRLLGAGGVTWFYLFKAIWPLHLRFFYAQWQIDSHKLLWWLPLIAALAVTLLLWWQRRTVWGKAIFTAWAYFCICLVPVMGFTDVGYMRFSLVADHYQHLAIIGVLALIAAAGSLVVNRVSNALRYSSMAMVGVLVGLLMWLTFRQCELYRNVDTLYESSMSYSWMAHSSLGGIQMYRGHPDLAIQHFQIALELNPNDEAAQIGMALALSRLGRFDEALKYAQRGVELWPDQPEAHNELGIALKRTGHLPEAIEQYQDAIRLDHEYASAYNNLGIAQEELGRSDEAIQNYQTALKYQSYFAEAHNNLGLALLKKGRLADAIEQLSEAVHLSPDLLEGRKNLGDALVAAGRPSEAIKHLEYFVAAFPNDADVWGALVVTYDETGRTADAIRAAEKGLAVARAQNNAALIKQLEDWLNANTTKPSPANMVSPAK